MEMGGAKFWGFVFVFLRFVSKVKKNFYVLGMREEREKEEQKEKEEDEERSSRSQHPGNEDPLSSKRGNKRYLHNEPLLHTC